MFGVLEDHTQGLGGGTYTENLSHVRILQARQNLSLSLELVPRWPQTSTSRLYI